MTIPSVGFKERSAKGAFHLKRIPLSAGFEAAR
jgi:hypothetical protein